MQGRSGFLTSPRGSSRGSVDVLSSNERDDIEVQIILRGEVYVAGIVESVFKSISNVRLTQ